MTKVPVSRESRTGAGPSASAAGARAISSPPILRLDGWTVRIAPLSIRRHGQIYSSASEIAIDLRALDAGLYRLIAVHNFHVEDCNPRLDECALGVFLAARRRDGAWEEPERFPVECRAVAVLAEFLWPGAEGARPRLAPAASDERREDGP